MGVYILLFISKLLKLLDPELVLMCGSGFYTTRGNSLLEKVSVWGVVLCTQHRWFPAGRGASLPAWTEAGAGTTALTGHSSHPPELWNTTLDLGWANWINPGICSGVWSDVAVLAAAAQSQPHSLLATPLILPPLSLSDQMRHLWWALNSLLIGGFGLTKFARAELGGNSFCHETGWWWVLAAGDNCGGL